MTKTLVVRAPSPRLLQACDGIDELIEHFIAKRSDVFPSGEFEAPIEALNLLYLGIRHIEGVLRLARYDLVALPPTMLAARAAFEASASAAWLVDCNDRFESEARWLAHLRKEQEYYDRIHNQDQDQSATPDDRFPDRHELAVFADAVAAQLAAKSVPVVTKPNFRQILVSLGAEDMYKHYITLSQFAHSTHYATRQFRQGLGGGKVLRERLTEEEWQLPLHLSCEALARFGKSVLDRTGRGQNRFPSPEVLKRARKYIRRVGELAS